MEMPWQGVAIIAFLAIVLAAALYGFGVLPWWGALIAGPLGAFAILAALLVLALLTADWSH